MGRARGSGTRAKSGFCLEPSPSLLQVYQSCSASAADTDLETLKRLSFWMQATGLASSLLFDRKGFPSYKWVQCKYRASPAMVQTTSYLSNDRRKE